MLLRARPNPSCMQAHGLRCSRGGHMSRLVARPAPTTQDLGRRGTEGSEASPPGLHGAHVLSRPARSSTVTQATGRAVSMLAASIVAGALGSSHPGGAQVLAYMGAVGSALSSALSMMNHSILHGVDLFFSMFSGLVGLTLTAINDPWEPVEVWFIIAWRIAYRGLLRFLFTAYTCIHEAWAHRTLNQKPELYSDKAFEESFFGFLLDPCGQLSYVYMACYFKDMLQRALSGPLPSPSTSAFFNGFDEAAYTIFGTLLLVDIIETYLPKYLKFMEKSNRAEKGDKVERANPVAREALVRLASLAAYVLGGAGVLKALGLTAGAIGLASVGGLAFSLASKSLVENLMGGIFLVLRSPFGVNDRIALGDGKISGTVLRIGWLTTVIQQKTGVPLYVPNSVFFSGSISNQSRNTHTLLNEEVTIYAGDADKMPAILSDIEAFLFEWEMSDYPNKPKKGGWSAKLTSDPRVGISKLDENGIHLEIVVFLGPCPGKASGMLFKGRSELLQAVGNILAKHGARLGTQVEVSISSEDLIHPFGRQAQSQLQAQAALTSTA